MDLVGCCRSGSDAHLAQHHRSCLQAAKLIEPEIAKGRNVGAFQAGILAYFTKSNLINLDGKVNPEAGEWRDSTSRVSGRAPAMGAIRRPPVRCEELVRS